MIETTVFTEGNTFATMSDSGVVRLWEVRDGIPVEREEP